MRKTTLALAATLACAFGARADEPIKSADAFEADVRACLLKEKDPAACLERVFRGHFSPGNEKVNEVVGQVTGVLRKWLGTDKVFAVHPVKSKKIGEFYDERVYLVEDTTGSVLMIEVGVVNKHGKWWLHRFNLSSQKDKISAVLGVEL